MRSSQILPIRIPFLKLFKWQHFMTVGAPKCLKTTCYPHAQNTRSEFPGKEQEQHAAEHNAVDKRKLMPRALEIIFHLYLGNVRQPDQLVEGRKI